MRTTIIAWSLTLAAVPAWAQQTGSGVKRTLPVAASHVALPSKPVPSPEKSAAAPEKPEKTEKAPAPEKTGAAPAAGKPAATKTSDSAESAAERIMRRLDEAFPKKAPGEKAAAPKAPIVKPRPVPHATGTPTPQRASNHVTLNWRISLRWPDEIAPVHQVK